MQEFMLASILLLWMALVFVGGILFFEVVLSIPFYKFFRNNEAIKQVLKEATYFYANELDIKGKPTINLHFEFPKRYCTLFGYMTMSKEKENTFNVTVFLNHDTWTLLKVLAHEMIHVRQYAHKEVVIEGEKRYWKGKDYTNCPYEKRPWEIEAFEKEDALCNKYLKHKGLKKPLIVKFFHLFLAG